MLSEWWSDLRHRVRAIVGREDLERELDDELRFHLEREADKYVAAGLTPDEARRRARIAFGGLDRTKEEARDARGTVLLETVAQDFRYATRGLRARPAFTLGVALTLGLGLGANVAMFGVVDRLLLRPPAYLSDVDHVHRVYVSWQSDKRERTEREVQVPRYRDFARWTHAFSLVAAFHTWRAAVGDGDAARERYVTAASASYFDLFDVRPALGRFYSTREDSMPIGAPVVVLGYTYWQTELGGRADVLGRSLRIGRTLCTIVGVAPEHFTGISDGRVPAVYVPLATFAWDLRGKDYSGDYRWSWLELAVRREPDVSVSAANADLTTAFRRSWIAQADAIGMPPALESYRPRAAIGPVQLERGPQAGAEGKVVVWLSGVALIVLIIACANVANLLLARALARRREIALRIALGAGRGRLVRQLLTETALLAVLGGVVALLVAHWGRGILQLAMASNEASTSVFGDTRTLLATAVAITFTALVTGLAPALFALRSEGATALGSDREVGARHSRTRTTLLVLQTTLSVVLLVGAGLFIRSLRNVRALRLGYDVAPVLMLTAHMRGVALNDTERVQLEERLVAEAASMPGVVGATRVASIPFWANESQPLFVPGIDSVGSRGNFYLQAGSPSYFETMGTRILRGRNFDAGDVARSPRVTIVSHGMARALWPGADPLGKCIRIAADTAPCTTVIGVAEEMRLRSLTDASDYTYYLPMTQYGGATGMMLVRVSGAATDYTDLVRRRLQRVMPGAAYVTAEPFGNAIDPTMQSWRVGATMFVTFGALAVVLAGIGLYGVIAYGVAQRRQEIGVRIALGAPRGQLVRMVIGSGLRLVAVGLAIGTAIALGTGHWIAGLLFQVSASDPIVLLGVAAVLALVAVAGSALPAAAAARVDPNVTLRGE